MLVASGAGAQIDVDAAAEQARGLGRFIRSLLGLDREATDGAGRPVWVHRAEDSARDSSPADLDVHDTHG